MKVVYVITLMDILGGVQVHVRDLSCWLASRGHEVTIVTGALGLPLLQLDTLGVKTIVLPELVRSISPMNDYRAVQKLRRHLKNIAPDVVSCHSSKAGVIGRLAAWLEGIPVIFTAHGWAFTPGVGKIQERLYALVERVIAPLSSHIITVSRYDKTLALEAGVGIESQITTIHNGMPAISVQPRVTVDHETRIIMVGRFWRQKDYTTLLKAMAMIRDLSWKLHLVGGGDASREVQLAHQLGINDRIIFHGQRADIVEMLQEMDIFILLSHWEGFPRSILEAMRAGLPVIATDVAGVSESVQEGLTGFLIPREDCAAAADVLRRLISAPEQRVRLGINGRNSFVENFTFEDMARKTFNLYCAVQRKSDDGSAVKQIVGS